MKIIPLSNIRNGRCLIAVLFTSMREKQGFIFNDIP